MVLILVEPAYVAFQFTLSIGVFDLLCAPLTHKVE